MHLQIACRIGSPESESVLLEKSANPNVSDGIFGEPPIIIAVRSHDSGALDLLVKYGADIGVSAKDEEFTVLSVAMSSNLQNIERRSLEHRTGVNTSRKQGARGLLKDSGCQGAEITDWRDKEQKVGGSKVLKD